MRGAGYLAFCGAVLGLAVGGCGGSEGDTSTERRHPGGPNGETSQTSPRPGSTQPEAPCMPVPDHLIDQITGGLNSKIKVAGDVWQMVHANKLHELGLDNPYFISARARVAPDPTTYGSWTVQDLKHGTVIPLDGTAKAGTKRQKGIDPNAYQDLVTNDDYTQSRECAQEQFELMQEARKK
jgi:hypothetical protein